MRFRTKQKHMIDLIFPVSLFLVFALCALTVLLLAARIYRSSTENAAQNNTSRTGLSYIREKIRQNDNGGSIRIGELNGTEALIIEQQYEDTAYQTCIYCSGNFLCELFIKEGVEADLSAGTRLLEVESFSMEALSDNLFQFDCTAQNGRTERILVSTKSR